MDFFASQEHSRRQTRWMLVLFAVALVLVVAAVDSIFLLGGELILMGGMTFAQARTLLGWTSSITAGLILTVTVVRILKLRGGGEAVARLVGARRLARTSTHPDEKRLLNVVDEMAIAAGTPVPAAYVLDREPAINTFVAGYSPSQAVVVVTQGALANLNRDELQAVMAHEFSHILNGDMRLNVRLIGWLAGIMVLGSLGLRLVRLAIGADSDWSVDILPTHRNLALIIGMSALGGLFAAIGYIGVFFGRLIKAGVSREREFLADASAVQFTRNPEALAMALHKIAVLSARTGSYRSYGEELSHMFFTNARRESRSDWMSTHPPIDERIRRILPTFSPPDRLVLPAPLPAGPPADGEDEILVNADGKRIIPADDPVLPRYARRSEVGAVSLAAPPSQSIVAAVGNPDRRHLDRAATLLSSLPPAIADAVRAPDGAQATVLALVLDPRAEVLEAQKAVLTAVVETDVARRTLALLPSLQALDPAARLPLLDLAMCGLSALDPVRRQSFQLQLERLIRGGGRMTIPQMVVQVVVANGLKPHAARMSALRFRKVAEVGADAATILALLAYAGGTTPFAEQSYARGIACLDLDTPPPMPAVTELSADRVLAALWRLGALVPLEKPFVVRACAECAGADGTLQVREMEIMRALSAAIDCPLPPTISRSPGGGWTQ